MELHGVIDPQPGNLGFALFDGEGKLLKQADRSMHGRDAAELPEFIAGVLAQLDLELSSVSRWTIGSGPGSFTFLRLVAALAAGWKFADDSVKFRCVPGALALGASLKAGEKAGILYDGRNKEILFFGVTHDGTALTPSGETAVLNNSQCAAFFAEHKLDKLFCFASELAAIQAVLPAEINVEPASPDLAALAGNRSIGFDNDLNSLVYIRPAVF